MTESRGMSGICRKPPPTKVEILTEPEATQRRTGEGSAAIPGLPKVVKARLHVAPVHRRYAVSRLDTRRGAPCVIVPGASVAPSRPSTVGIRQRATTVPQMVTNAFGRRVGGQRRPTGTAGAPAEARTLRCDGGRARNQLRAVWIVAGGGAYVPVRYP